MNALRLQQLRHALKQYDYWRHAKKAMNETGCHFGHVMTRRGVSLEALIQSVREAVGYTEGEAADAVCQLAGKHLEAAIEVLAQFGTDGRAHLHAVPEERYGDLIRALNDKRIELARAELDAATEAAGRAQAELDAATEAARITKM